MQINTTQLITISKMVNFKIESLADRGPTTQDKVQPKIETWANRLFKFFTGETQNNTQKEPQKKIETQRKKDATSKMQVSVGSNVPQQKTTDKAEIELTQQTSAQNAGQNSKNTQNHKPVENSGQKKLDPQPQKEAIQNIAENNTPPLTVKPVEQIKQERKNRENPFRKNSRMQNHEARKKLDRKLLFQQNMPQFQRQFFRRRPLPFLLRRQEQEGDLPISKRQEQPEEKKQALSRLGRIRVKNELEQIKQNPSHLWNILKSDPSTNYWLIKVTAEPQSPYHTFPFKMRVIFPFDYPHVQSELKLQQEQIKRFYHPNISKNGILCEKTLKNKTASMKVRDKVDAFIALLSNPNPDSAWNKQAAALFESDKIAYFKRALKQFQGKM